MAYVVSFLIPTSGWEWVEEKHFGHYTAGPAANLSETLIDRHGLRTALCVRNPDLVGKKNAAKQFPPNFDLPLE